MSDRLDTDDRRPAPRGRSRRSRSAPGGVPPTRDDAPGPVEDEPGDPEQVARAICLRALTGAAKTRKQLADLLAKRGVPEDAALTVLDRFTEVGLIDDAAFASAWVSSRQAGRGLARRALRAELQAKGVDREVAAAALEEVTKVYVPWSMSSIVPCAPSNKIRLPCFIALASRIAVSHTMG